MGSKRRENYDDWWRCEIRFDAVLDEAFGITHTKQQIRPKEYLLEALQPYVEIMAKALNGRVRQVHTDIKVGIPQQMPSGWLSTGTRNVAPCLFFPQKLTYVGQRN